MDNKIYKIGDSLVINIKPKQKGTAIITGFIDSFIGLSEGKTLKREYRIAEDDLFYSDWLILSEKTILGKKIKQNNTIQVKYTRTGTDASGDIEFQNIEFKGDFEPEIINSPILDGSIFADIAWDDKTDELAKNIFKKLYFRGIIPTYVLRGDNIDINEDRDYITLFWTIAKFYAIIFSFFKRFENFYNDEELMLEWIRQNGINFDESLITIEQLQFLANNFYDEIRKRGTKMIFNYEGDVVNGVVNKIDGEFVRLIRSKKCDELLYENIPLNKIGWCLRQSSPLYRGTCFAERLNKTKENTQYFQDVNNFQTFALSSSTVSIEDESDKKGVLLLKTIGNSACGLGRYNASTEISDRIYPADANLDYEITFMFKVKLAGNNSKLHFGVEAFDISKRKVNDAFITINGNSITEKFLDGISLDKFKEGTWYFVRGIIHAYSSEVVENVKLNIGHGNNICFNNTFIKYILPHIYITSNNSSSVCVWDYKIRPMVRGTNILSLRSGYQNSHSLGFIQSPKIFYAYFRNNNNSQSKDEITDIIERYLLPFNMTDILQFIDNK